jgi:hypothetical protein
MKKKENLNEMSYNELVAKNVEVQKSIQKLMAKSVEYQKAINLKKEESIKEALRACMKTYGVTKEEMKSILDGEESINPVIPQKVYDLTETEAIPEVKEDNEVETPAIPEPQEENKVETKTTSVFDLPALQEEYNPLETKKRKTPAAPEKTLVEGTEETLPTMESLLCDDPEYKAFYHPVTPEKKNNRRLPTLDELLSKEPVNKILCLGNEEPKGKAYRQHTRINHVKGIIPTETATGKTTIYIPAA